MLDFGAYAQIVADGKMFSGLPGRSLDSLRTNERRGPDDLLSVLEKLAVGADAQYDGAEEVRGTSCHKFSVRSWTWRKSRRRQPSSIRAQWTTCCRPGRP
jgi:hypothetical protein